MSQENHNQRPEKDTPPNSPAYVVGVGASAGGLEALERLFEHMPARTGAAFVVIQHLSPDFRSLTDELLARRTKIPIHQAENNMRVETDAIYLIPPKKDMIISDGRLLLTDKDPAQVLTLPIDRFFRSLAQDCGSHAVGIVLSGTGSDGSRGIRDIHEAGGLVIAQTSETAKFDGMPRSAVGTGVVDYALPPEEIPVALVRHFELPFGTLDKLATADEPSLSISATDAIFRLLRDAYGIDFASYKPETVARRTDRRLAISLANSIEEYAARLAQDPVELNQLYRDLLIGVTGFFRDPEAFASIERDILPVLLRQVPRDGEFRAWVAGCATGEEAYSLAILVQEAIEKMERPIAVRIFATDVHKASLDLAGAGVYSLSSLSAMSPARRSRFFLQRGDQYHVSPELRKLVVFAQHNLLKDAPFTKLDLVTCRNLLIYLQPLAQKKVLSLFHFGLKTGGVLFLGPSETGGDLADELETLDPRWKIYRKRRDVRLPPDIRLSAGMGSSILRLSAQPTPTAVSDVQLLGESLLEECLPPSLLINESREIVRVFAGANRYLKLRDGWFSTDVLELVDSELRTALAGALPRVFNDQKPILFRGLRAHVDNQGLRVNLSVKPFRSPRTGLTYALVRLEPLDTKSGSEDARELDLGQASKDQVLSLETELRSTKENLQAMIEELETSNEELQATNEELVASNEELQSTNEELHSVNEELYTVNGEYQRKIHELTELTSDMDNLLASTQVHTVFLDRELRIRKFTPSIAETFNLMPQDIGRRIESFTYSLDHPGLVDDFQEVLSNGKSVERQLQDRRGRWYLMRVLPYQAGAVTAGVVLTLIDVTLLKEAEQRAQEAVVQRDRFLAMLSHELRNPLAAILNTNQLLVNKGISTEESARWLGVIERRASHMARLLDDLLDVARITQNKIDIRKECVDLVPMLRAAVEEAASWFEEHQLSLDVKEPTEPIYVEGDPARLLQIVVNLLTNAAKYTPAGGRAWLELAAEGDEAVLRVRDTGVGLPAEMMESIFELFVQADGTLHRSDGGLGVGLTLVRMLVELHGGRVRANSPGVGQGAEFTVWLPRCEPPIHPSPSSGNITSKGEPLHILLVEDDADSRQSLKLLLEMDGHRVIAVGTGNQALEVLERERPGLAIVDIGIPGLNGYEVARQATERYGPNRPRLIALTGYGRARDRQAAKAAGFDAHLTKPLQPRQLSQILQSLPMGASAL